MTDTGSASPGADRNRDPGCRRALAALVVAALVLPRRPAPALFGIGAVTVLLLAIGIHNAWDIVTYIAAEPMPPEVRSHA